MLEFENCRLELMELRAPLQSLKEALHLDIAEQRASEMEARSLQPEFWQDPEMAQKTQRELTHLRRKISRYDKLKAGYDDMLVMLELGEESDDAELEEELRNQLEHWKVTLEDMRLETYFTGEHDDANALINLHAGAGGTEAMDWCSMLFRMYTRWAERRDFRTEVLDSVDGEEAGLKSISFRIEGENAYGLLRSEMGVHRLVRISPFDNSGRRHTSFASVEIMPELDDSIEINIRSEDLRVDYYRASGAGGQHVNKTSSAVRLTHLPTGVVVACQNERSQIQNKETAMRMLRSKLYTLALQSQMERVEDLKGEQMDIAWGSQIRSYVFCPYTMVKDNRSQLQTSDVEGVMDGEIDPFITAWLAMEAMKPKSTN